MTRSLAERLHERLESQTAEIAALTESELTRLSRRVTESVTSELNDIEIAIVQSTHGITNALPSLKWILGLTWGALIVSLMLTGFLLWRSSQPLRVVEDMPLETFQSEGQSYLVVPENATPLQCTTPSGRKAICLHMKNGD